MDEIEEAKEALEEIHTFIRQQIRNGTLQNVGFNDGASEEFNFEGISLVQVKHPVIGTLVNENVYYYNDEVFATVYRKNNATSLDNENMDEIDKIMEIYEEIKPKMDLVINNKIELAKSSINEIDQFIHQQIKNGSLKKEGTGSDRANEYNFKNLIIVHTKLENSEEHDKTFIYLNHSVVSNIDVKSGEIDINNKDLGKVDFLLKNCENIKSEMDLINTLNLKISQTKNKSKVTKSPKI